MPLSTYLFLRWVKPREGSWVGVIFIQEADHKKNQPNWFQLNSSQNIFSIMSCVIRETAIHLRRVRRDLGFPEWAALGCLR